MRDLIDIIVALRDSRINGEASSFVEGIWTVKIGDPINGYVAEAVVADAAQAAEWLRVNAVRLYPKSEFAERYRGPRAANC